MNNSQYYLEMIEETNNEMNLFEQDLMSGNIESIQEGLFGNKTEISKSEWNTIKKDIIKIYEEAFDKYIKRLEDVQKTRKLWGLSVNMYKKKFDKSMENIKKKLDKIESKGKGSLFKSIEFGCTAFTLDEKEVCNIILSSTAQKYYNKKGVKP